MISPNNIKEPLSFQQQLDHLINDKGLIVKNKNNALNILKHENYYRLSGYMIDFLDENDKFINNTCFEDIYNIYKTDKEMRSILFELINDIEVYLKTQSANYFSITYGALGYLDPDNYLYKSQGDYQKVIEFIKKCNEVNKKNEKSLIVSHHNNKYHGFMPIWAIFELMTFGTISKFYSLLKTTDKKGILRSGFKDINDKKLESMYHTVTNLRNQCCHYNRLYRKRNTIRCQKYTSKEINVSDYDTDTTYASVISLLLINPNKKLGERAIGKLKNLSSHSHIDFCKNYGFPQNWKTELYEINGHCIKQ